MNKSLRLHLLFYRNFAWPTNVISVFGCYSIIEAGTATYFIPIAMIKVITNGLIGVMVHFFKNNQLYFFQNLGASTGQLYASAFTIDMSLWFLMTAITCFLI